ncbi:hypothetical protein A2690_02850 [Candidatus Roizmanbacteria bacterium RIFCSPHIGHO2_01_FULL_39_12b]|uniref:Uncharacterized protein n=1 Tax=Candidatus Roizmanbacteria bacterium RIFCSPHIGHO2_01_FULL_39_12b TaxID=1802030 RepID=A0A1F7GBQ1_9BACT|nr:MAG: hypothetical protein A2690_02850 [Candidatus Roizmanbacteria bacterium RIFCSPHIGHO2_01_FULL_39_12b]
MNQTTTVTKSEFDRLVEQVARLERLVLGKITKTSNVESKPLKLTAYAKRILKEADEEIKRGDVSPAFDNVKDALEWLHSKNKKYANQL